MASVSETPGMDSLFAPTSIAVVGASRRPDGAGNQVIRNLLGAGFAGKIHVVNPSGATIEGIESARTIKDLPSVDVAVLAVPSASVVSALCELAEAGCPAVVVPAVGMSSADEAKVADLAKETGMFIHGSNCMGIIDVSADTPMWIDEGILMGLPKGNVSLVSQSGSGAIFVARSARNIGFSKVISTGNEICATSADYISWLAGDPDTSVIGVVLESIPDGPAFQRAVAEAQAAAKAVVVLKVGRTAAGAKATTAHTGAILSDTEAYDAFFERLDVPVVEDYDELAAALECISGLGDRQVDGTNVGVVTISGGQAALAADLAEAVGLNLPQFTPEVQRVLTDLLPGVLIHNPLDAGGSVSASAMDYQNSLREVATDPAMDALLVILDGQETLSDAEINFEEEYYRAVEAVAREFGNIPIVVASSSSLSLHPSALAWTKGSVPVIRGIRNALVALAAASRNRLPQPIAPRPEGLPDKEKVGVLAAQLRGVAGPVPADLALEVLTAYGIETVSSARVKDAEQAASWAAENAYPVVLKVDSKDIAHRSDVGGVVTGIQDEQALHTAAASILQSVSEKAPHAVINGFEIQEQVSTEVEAFAGFVSDLRLGQTIGVGLGGTLVELLNDTARAHAPLDSAQAAGLVNATNVGRILAGYRSLIPVTPATEFAELVSRLSWMAFELGPELSELDLNPVLIEPGSGRPRIVDALLVARG